MVTSLPPRAVWRRQTKRQQRAALVDRDADGAPVGLTGFVDEARQNIDRCAIRLPVLERHD